mmetsp:Transcript_20956/g.48682  ORF Transcript_20956/g.48682 Transcript_20956/m.48682 type:complete len:147 (-) Transcript_20956:55-495(-)
MDQRGSRYGTDLGVLEERGLLRRGTVVVVDNALKPGAPLYLWQVMRSSAWPTSIVDVREFAMPSRDWMAISAWGCGSWEQPSDADPPRALQLLHVASDGARRKATGPGQSVDFEEWAAFAEEMRRELAGFGIAATSTAARTAGSLG